MSQMGARQIIKIMYKRASLLTEMKAGRLDTLQASNALRDLIIEAHGLQMGLGASGCLVQYFQAKNAK